VRRAVPLAAETGGRRPGGWQPVDVALEDTDATLVSFGAHGNGIAAPRRGRLIDDSPRSLARDDRAAHLADQAEPPR
jgi:hypothetical protein